MKITLTKKKKLPLANKTAIINSPVWPITIDEELICKSTEDYTVRACSIVESFLPAMQDKKFYDPTKDELIRREVSIRGGITDANTSFDVVLLYDILDHIDNPVSYLKDVAAKVNPKGKLYVRCHPWTSRHGTHLYHQINKAFIHLFLTPEELASLKLIDKLTYKYTPTNYIDWFNQAGLKVLSTDVITTPIEPIFSQLINRGLFDSSYLKLMNISFVDYILAP